MSSIAREEQQKLGGTHTGPPYRQFTDAELRESALEFLLTCRDLRRQLEEKIVQHKRGTRRMIAMAWNQGLAEYRIAEAVGLSRRAVKAYLAEADENGELVRPRFPAEGSGRRAKVSP
jgi:hypothetical protein